MVDTAFGVQGPLVNVLEISVFICMPISQVTELVGMQMKSDISSTLTNGPWTPNSPVTIARKGSSRPLIDTGELRASITYRTEK